MINAILKYLGIAEDSLPSSATAAQISTFEQGVGHRLPLALRNIYMLHNGEYRNEDRPIVSPGIFYGYQFRSLDHAIYEYRRWDRIRKETKGADSGSIIASPHKTVRGDYSRAGWIPFAGGYGGAQLAIDYDPDIEGNVGQVINFGRDDLVHFKIADSFDDFLNAMCMRYSRREWHPKFMGDDWSLYDQLVSAIDG